MPVDELPLFRYLEGAEKILLAGAGGGFDVFSGLPLYFALKARGKNVSLASLSFSNLDGVDGPRLAPGVAEVSACCTRVRARLSAPSPPRAWWSVSETGTPSASQHSRTTEISSAVSTAKRLIATIERSPKQ